MKNRCISSLRTTVGQTVAARQCPVRKQMNSQFSTKCNRWWGRRSVVRKTVVPKSMTGYGKWTVLDRDNAWSANVHKTGGRWPKTTSRWNVSKQRSEVGRTNIATSVESPVILALDDRSPSATSSHWLNKRRFPRQAIAASPLPHLEYPATLSPCRRSVVDSCTRVRKRCCYTFVPNFAKRRQISYIPQWLT